MRECGQNSLDAAATPEQTVTVRIDRVSLDKTDLPFMPALEKILRACRDHWSQHEKATKFFTAALTLARRQHIDALKISDLGTTGVDGSDEDNMGRWFGLVKSAASRIRRGTERRRLWHWERCTVGRISISNGIGSTRTLDGQVALQGVPDS